MNYFFSFIQCTYLISFTQLLFIFNLLSIKLVTIILSIFRVNVSLVHDSLPITICIASEEGKEEYFKKLLVCVHVCVVLNICFYNIFIFLFYNMVYLTRWQHSRQDPAINYFEYFFLEILTFCFFLLMCPGMATPSLGLYEFFKKHHRLLWVRMSRG